MQTLNARSGVPFGDSVTSVSVAERGGGTRVAVDGGPFAWPAPTGRETCRFFHVFDRPASTDMPHDTHTSAFASDASDGFGFVDVPATPCDASRRTATFLRRACDGPRHARDGPRRLRDISATDRDISTTDRDISATFPRHFRDISATFPRRACRWP